MATVEQGNNDNFNFFVDGKIQLKEILTWIWISTENANRLRITEDNIIWRYDGGYFEPNGERYIKSMLNGQLGTKISEHNRNEIISNVRYNDDKWIKYFDFDKDKYLINLANGIYNINTGELIKHSPDYLFAHKLPIDYKPEAKPERFLKFLNEVIDETDLPIIQELIGYLFYKEYTFHKAFMFLGNGGNGKSTLIYVMEKLIGKENIATIPLKIITENKFCLAHLHQKLANLCADLTERELRETGSFKMLTGEDTIYADRKYQEPLEFHNYAKLIFSCNQIPYSRDDTDAYFERWIIINFPNKFRGTDRCNPFLKGELTTQDELSGIFNWAMVGLQRLLAQEGFSHSKSTDETRSQYIRSSSSTKSFVDEMLFEEIDAEVDKDEVFRCYKAYCEAYDLKPSNKWDLTKKINDSFTKVSDGRRHDGVRYWKHITISPLPPKLKLDVINFKDGWGKYLDK